MAFGRCDQSQLDDREYKVGLSLLNMKNIVELAKEYGSATKRTVIRS
jgi:hypothetical protein